MSNKIRWKVSEPYHHHQTELDEKEPGVIADDDGALEGGHGHCNDSRPDRDPDPASQKIDFRRFCEFVETLVEHHDRSGYTCNVKIGKLLISRSLSNKEGITGKGINRFKGSVPIRTTGCPAKMWKMQDKTDSVINVSEIPIKPSVFFSEKINSEQKCEFQNVVELIY